MLWENKIIIKYCSGLAGYQFFHVVDQQCLDISLKMILPFETTWMDVEGIILSEISQ